MRSRVLPMAILVAAPLMAGSSAGVTWTDPAGWKSLPQRPMRAATYVVPKTAGDAEDGECAVFYFGQGQGGGIQENIDRWIGQFEGKPAAPPKPVKRAIAGLNVTSIDHNGTYLAGGPMSPMKTPKPGYRMIGAIVEAPEGNLFFKLTGPAKTVAAAQPLFDRMLASIKK